MFDINSTIISRLGKHRALEFLGRIIKNKYLRFIFFIITIGFIALFLIRNINSVRDLMTSGIFSSFDILEISILLITALIFGGLSWHMILLSLGIKSKWYLIWQNYYESSLMRYVPGLIWSYLGKSFFVHTQGASKNISLTAVIVEFLLQVFTGIVIITLLIPLEFIFDDKLITYLINGLGVIIGVTLLAVPVIINGSKKKSPNFQIETKYFFIANLLLYLGWIILGVVFKKISSMLLCSLGGPFSIWAYTFAHISGLLAIPTINGIGVREFVLMKCISTYCSEINILLVSLISRTILLFCELLLFGISSVIKHESSKSNTK